MSYVRLPPPYTHNSPVELMTSGEEMTRVADSVSSGAGIMAAPIASHFQILQVHNFFTASDT